MRTVIGVEHKTYSQACYALGLLDGNKEWSDSLVEALGWATGNEFRHLFVTIPKHCRMSDVRQLWKNNYEYYQKI